MTLAVMPNTAPEELELEQLPALINAEHAAAEEGAKSAVQHAFQCGQYLNAAKAKCKHGDWLPWLAENFKASQPTAFKYMKLAANYNRGNNLEEPESIRDAMRQLADASTKTHVANNSGENEWYTPAEYVEAARKVMGTIDTDPASSKKANKTVRADVIYTAENSGLEHPWAGNVWMNPPYAQPLIAQFCEKAVDEYTAKRIKSACVLVNNASDAKWGQLLLNNCTAVCFPAGRIRFIDQHGEPSGAPLQGQMIVYFGRRAATFQNHFSQFGCVFV